MAHVAKYAKGAIGHLTAHYERQKDEVTGEYIRFANQNINPALTHLNYNLGPTHEGGQIAFINRRLNEVKVQQRADVKIMCSWIATLPQNVDAWVPTDAGQSAQKNDDQANQTIPTQSQASKLFLERTYKFLAYRYGEQNVVSAYAHLDESRPHLHFSFIPVVFMPEVEKNGRRRGGYHKVSAKELINRKELQIFHGDLENHLDSFGDYHFEILNEATKDGNKTVAQLKIETNHKAVKESKRKADEARKAADDARQEVAELHEQIETLKTEKDTLNAAEVAALKGTRTLTGGLKNVSYKDYEALKRTASRVESVDEENKNLELRHYFALDKESRLKKELAQVKKERDDALEPVAGNTALLEHKNETIDRLNREVRWFQDALSKIKSLLKQKAPQLLEELVDIFPSRNYERERS